MKYCSELFEIYTTFQALFKTQHFAGIKCFRFDLNGQYNSNKFYELLVLDGTIHQTLCTDTLQQNDCNNPDLPHSFSRYIGNFQVIIYIYIYTGSTKFLPKFRQILPYNRTSQVIDKTILHFQF